MSDENPYKPPEASFTQPPSIDRGTKASIALRMLFGLLAIGFMYSSVFVKAKPGPIGFLGTSVIFVSVIFQCAHVAIVGRWFVPRLWQR